MDDAKERSGMNDKVPTVEQMKDSRFGKRDFHACKDRLARLLEIRFYIAEIESGYCHIEEDQEGNEDHPTVSQTDIICDKCLSPAPCKQQMITRELKTYHWFLEGYLCLQFCPACWTSMKASDDSSHSFEDIDIANYPLAHQRLRDLESLSDS